MKILVINCGSSSLRFQLIDISRIEVSETLLAKGLVEKIGKPDAVFHCTAGTGDAFRLGKTIRDYRTAIETAFEFLLDKGVIQSMEDIEGVGHRIVHGGERFRQKGGLCLQDFRGNALFCRGKSGRGAS